MIDLFLAALLLGLASAGVVRLLRALPPVQRQMEKGIKPWACDVCMTFWTMLGLSIAMYRFTPLYSTDPDLWTLATFAAYAVGLFVLGKISEPNRPPPMFPEE